MTRAAAAACECGSAAAQPALSAPTPAAMVMPDNLPGGIFRILVLRDILIADNDGRNVRGRGIPRVDDAFRSQI